MIKKKYPPIIPELKNCEIVGLFNSSNLQVAISRVSISVFEGNLKGKSGRLRDFGLLVSHFLFFSFLINTKIRL